MENIDNKDKDLRPTESEARKTAGAKGDVRAISPAKKRTGMVFFILSCITFVIFSIVTLPFVEAVLTNSAKDIGEALGLAFGLVFTILLMGLIGIPHIIFSLVSTIMFGTSIGKTDKPDKTKAIVFFSISLFLLLAVIAIAVISFFAIRNA